MSDPYQALVRPLSAILYGRRRDLVRRSPHALMAMCMSKRSAYPRPRRASRRRPPVHAARTRPRPSRRGWCAALAPPPPHRARARQTRRAPQPDRRRSAASRHFSYGQTQAHPRRRLPEAQHSRSEPAKPRRLVRGALALLAAAFERGAVPLVGVAEAAVDAGGEDELAARVGARWDGGDGD